MGRTQISPALRGEHRRHETATKARRCELGGDDGAQRIIPSHAHAHDEPPYDENTDDVHTRTGSGKRLSKGGRDDNHELYPICFDIIRTFQGSK
jgi:hypothetical protein